MDHNIGGGDESSQLPSTVRALQIESRPPFA
jgi:hypothetical protein